MNSLFSQRTAVQESPDNTKTAMKTLVQEPRARHSTKKRSGTEERRAYQSKSRRLARFMFTRRTYRIAALIMLTILVLLGILEGLVIIWIKNLGLRIEEASRDNQTIYQLKSKGLNVTASCEFESDVDPNFYTTLVKWRMDLCNITCGPGAFAFRRNRVVGESRNKTYCYDMAPCHLNQTGYCGHITPTIISEHFTFCPGKNGQPMPKDLITGNDKMNFSVSLFKNGTKYEDPTDLAKLQKVLLEPLYDTQILGQSLVTRCPKCMVNSRCFTPGRNQYIPQLGTIISTPLRQLATLRVGFPFYAMLCDGFELLTNGNENLEACPALDP